MHVDVVYWAYIYFLDLFSNIVSQSQPLSLFLSIDTENITLLEHFNLYQEGIELCNLF